MTVAPQLADDGSGVGLAGPGEDGARAKAPRAVARFRPKDKRQSGREKRRGSVRPGPRSAVAALCCDHNPNMLAQDLCRLWIVISSH